MCHAWPCCDPKQYTVRLYDPEGHTLWVRDWSVPSAVGITPADVCISPLNGDVIVCGPLVSAASPADEDDVRQWALRCYKNDGTTRWRRTLQECVVDLTTDDTQNPAALAVDIDDAGNVYVLSDRFFWFQLTPETPILGQVIAKFDAAGNWLDNPLETSDSPSGGPIAYHIGLNVHRPSGAVTSWYQSDLFLTRSPVYDVKYLDATNRVFAASNLNLVLTPEVGYEPGYPSIYIRNASTVTASRNTWVSPAGPGDPVDDEEHCRGVAVDGSGRMTFSVGPFWNPDAGAAHPVGQYDSSLNLLWTYPHQAWRGPIDANPDGRIAGITAGDYGTDPDLTTRKPSIVVLTAEGQLDWQHRHGNGGSHKVNYQSCRTDDPVTAEIQRREFEEKLRCGVTDPYAQHRDRPLIDQAQEFYQYLKASGVTEKQAMTVLMRVRRILEDSGMKSIADLSPTKVKTTIARMTRQPHKKSVPREQWPLLSAQSRNFYLGSIKQFVRWLQIDRRIPDNPLLGLKRENVAVDRRHDRRAFTDAEIAQLIQAARSSTVSHEGMTGPDRARLYLLAVSTGLRRNEIASLRKSSFQLDDRTPTVTLEAAYSKHRRQDVLPLHPDLVIQLRDWVSELEPHACLFPGLAGRKTFEMIKRDLKVAGVNYRSADGKYADFHALRHTFITRAWTTGATPDVVRALARHCDINLTLKYTHTTQAAQADAMQKMPGLPTPKNSPDERG